MNGSIGLTIERIPVSHTLLKLVKAEKFHILSSPGKLRDLSPNLSQYFHFIGN